MSTLNLIINHKYINVTSIILGGVLADYVFNPFMKGDSDPANALRILVGSTEGSGMGVMFLCTGILGFTSCMILSKNKHIKKLKFKNDGRE